MAKSTYTTTFSDGSSETGIFENADQAKQAHRNDRIRKLDPGGSRLRADVFTHGSVKVVSVAEQKQQGGQPAGQAPGARGGEQQQQDQPR